MDRVTRVLILEDNPSDIELIKRELRKAGLDATTQTVQDESTFRQALDQFNPDIILADYSLPTFDGLSALTLARKRNPDFPVIIVSGAIGEEFAIEAMKAGATDYVLKHKLGRLGPVVHRALRESEELAARKHIEQQLREQQNALHESQERLALIVQSAEIGVWDWNIRTDELVWCQRCRSLFGVPPDYPVTYEFFLNTLHPEDRQRVDQVVRRSLEEHRENYSAEMRTIWPDESVHWITAFGKTYYSAAGKAERMTGAALDITRLKKIEEDLLAAKISAERAKAAAEDANAAKDRFLAVLSHELRTPLTPVLASVSMLQKKAEADQKINRDLEMIRRNVELEARLIDDLLDLTRIARGKIQLDKRPVELNTVIGRAVDVCRPDIEARQLHFGVDMGEDPPYVVEADIARLQQVFWNLLKNAIKFTPHGGCVGIRCHANGNSTVTIEVKDTGVGIQPEALPCIFNAFAQADASITRQFGGLGLGLAISKSLIELHGGCIEARSEGRNKGATFTIKLPLVDLPGTSFAASGPATVPQQRPLRLLLVEDHGDTADMLKFILESEGHIVDTAGDVQTALKKADQIPFDLFISDLGLPDGSGLDLIRELRVRDHKLPGIALSGYGREEDIQRSRDAGFAAHVIKPVDVDKLVGVLAEISSSQLSQEIVVTG